MDKNYYIKASAELETSSWYLRQKLAKEKREKIANEPSEEEKEQIKMSEMISKAKDTCKDLGFKEGSEK